MKDPEVEAVARRCDKCQFWQPPKEGEWATIGIGRCDKAKQLWHVTDWSKDDEGDADYISRVLLPEFADQLSFVQDGSDYMAHLLTKAEFYCAHFAALDDARRKEP